MLLKDRIFSKGSFITMKVRKGDKVKILSGKDRGKIATVLKVLLSKNKVVVEGVNMVKKHIKPGTVTKEGGIVSIEKPVFASTVMYYNEKEKKAERAGSKYIAGKKTKEVAKPEEVKKKKVSKK